MSSENILKSNLIYFFKYNFRYLFRLSYMLIIKEFKDLIVVIKKLFVQLYFLMANCEKVMKTLKTTSSKV